MPFGFIKALYNIYIFKTFWKLNFPSMIICLHYLLLAFIRHIIYPKLLMYMTLHAFIDIQGHVYMFACLARIR